MAKQYKYINIGGAWNGEYGISGSIEIKKIPESLTTSDDKYGAKIKFYFFTNDKKEVGSKAPDFNIMVKNPDFGKEEVKDDLPFA